MNDYIKNFLNGKRLPVNLTPHKIVVAVRGESDLPEIEGTDGWHEWVSILPEDTPARVMTIEEEVHVDGIGFPCARQKVGNVTGLPPEDEERFYIVSRMVFDAVPDRKDVVVPDTGKTAVRDKSGNIVAVTRFLVH